MKRLGLVLALFLLVGGGAVALLPRETPPENTRRIYLAGGCYWGVEAVYEHLKGVRNVVSGFATPVFDSTLRNAGFVETVRIDYDPGQISYDQLLEILFLVAHDPTQVDRQGPDVGPQYRSLVFVDDSVERKTVEEYVTTLRTRQVYPAPIATEIAVLEHFREAPADHQDFVARNPDAPYVRNHDLPILAHLKERYSGLYR
jgi:peptide-methionine (S)-S-oxide reductase